MNGDNHHKIPMADALGVDYEVATNLHEVLGLRAK